MTEIERYRKRDERKGGRLEHASDQQDTCMSRLVNSSRYHGDHPGFDPPHPIMHMSCRMWFESQLTLTSIHRIVARVNIFVSELHVRGGSCRQNKHGGYIRIIFIPRKCWWWWVVFILQVIPITKMSEKKIHYLLRITLTSFLGEEKISVLDLVSILTLKQFFSFAFSRKPLWNMLAAFLGECSIREITSLLLNTSL